jgi:hypothetical protein
MLLLLLHSLRTTLLCYRLLKNEGVYICVSHGRPEDRLNVLEQWDIDKPNESLCWDVHVDAVAKPTVKVTTALVLLCYCCMMVRSSLALHLIMLFVMFGNARLGM